MPRFFEFSDTFAKFGFCTATIANSFFIYITFFYTKSLVGTYKLMILTFATLGILFSGMELLARPFLHNYNTGFMYFSLNTWLISKVSQRLMTAIITSYAGFAILLLSFTAVQFVFRYFSLTNSNWAKKFEGLGTLLWMLYPPLMGGIYAGSFWMLSDKDEFADRYFEEDILRVYRLAIREIPRMYIISYNPDGSFRWWNLTFLITGIVILGLQYSIILYCGIQMRRKIQKKLENVSVAYRKLHRQFFRALVLQTLAPTVIFIFPVSIVLLIPMLDIEISFQSGGIYALFSLYPPFDSIAFMLIVSEYRRVIKKGYRKLFTKKNKVPAEITFSNMTASRVGNSQSEMNLN